MQDKGKFCFVSKLTSKLAFSSAFPKRACSPSAMRGLRVMIDVLRVLLLISSNLLYSPTLLPLFLNSLFPYLIPCLLGPSSPLLPIPHLADLPTPSQTLSTSLSSRTSTRLTCLTPPYLQTYLLILLLTSPDLFLLPAPLNPLHLRFS